MSAVPSFRLVEPRQALVETVDGLKAARVVGELGVRVVVMWSDGPWAGRLGWLPPQRVRDVPLAAV